MLWSCVIMIRCGIRDDDDGWILMTASEVSADVFGECVWWCVCVVGV